MTAQLARHATANTLDVRVPQVPARVSWAGYRPAPVDITATVATLPVPAPAPVVKVARKGMHPALMILASCVIFICTAASFLAIGIMIGANR